MVWFSVQIETGILAMTRHVLVYTNTRSWENGTEYFVQQTPLLSLCM